MVCVRRGSIDDPEVDRHNGQAAHHPHNRRVAHDARKDALSCVGVGIDRFEAAVIGTTAQIMVEESGRARSREFVLAHPTRARVLSILLDEPG